MEVQVSLETLTAMLDDPFLHPAPGSRYKYGICLNDNRRGTFQFTAIPGITFIVDPHTTTLPTMGDYIAQEQKCPPSNE